MPDVAAVVLAAGRATRFGATSETSKVLALFEGKPLIRHVVDAARGAGIGEIVIVTGHAQEAVRAALADCGIRLVSNPDYADGLASSLRVGIAALSPDAVVALVLLADMPLVSAALIERLLGAFKADCDAVVPSRDNRWGNPVLLSRRLFSAVAMLTGDRGARALLEEPGRRVIVCPVEDQGIGVDIDTPTALERLEASRTSLRRP